MNLPTGFERRLEEAAELLSSQERIQVVSHIDADGLTSAAVASRALERAGVEHDVTFVKQLDDDAVSSLDDEPTLFTDLGSAKLREIDDRLETAVVVDHHEPGDHAAPDGGVHVNPHLFGLDGSSELSGATTTYLVAREMGDAPSRGNGGSDASSPKRRDNRDLSATAVVGAVGDLQAQDGLEGANRLVLDDGEEAGVVEERRDLAFFGKQTRPVHKMLEYSGDPYVPGVTGDERGALDLVEAAGVEPRTEGKWRRWIDLTEEEQRDVVSALASRLVQRNRGDSADRLVRETYVLLDEEEGTELRDASEFSTLLNATARYGRTAVGLDVCLGDRDSALEEGRALLRNHRRNLVEGLELVEGRGVTRLDSLQYFHAGDEILDTVVGIVAGMSFSLDSVARDLPIVAFAKDGEDVKVSARGTANLCGRGLNLAEALSAAAEEVGGAGGGHDVAAGATVPGGSEEDFLEVLDGLTGRQLSS